MNIQILLKVEDRMFLEEIELWTQIKKTIVIDNSYSNKQISHIQMKLSLKVSITKKSYRKGLQLRIMIRSAHHRI